MQAPTESAVTALLKRFKPAIASDGILSWEGDESKVNPRISKLAWQNGDPRLHQAKIAARREDLLADPLRDFTDSEKALIRSTPFTTIDSFIGQRRSAAPALKI